MLQSTEREWHHIRQLQLGGKWGEATAQRAVEADGLPGRPATATSLLIEVRGIGQGIHRGAQEAVDIWGRLGQGDNHGCGRVRGRGVHM